MDKTQRLHPDSSFVNSTDEEWKNHFPVDVYHVAREKGTEGPLPANMTSLRKSEPITVPFAEMLYSEVIQNSKVVVAGQVFMNRSVRQVSFI